MKLTKHQILVSIRLFSSVGIAPRLFFDVIGKIIISVLIIEVMMDDSALLVCMFVLNCIADISKKEISAHHLVMIACLLPSLNAISIVSPADNCLTELINLRCLLTLANPRDRVLSGLSVSSDLAWMASLCSASNRLCFTALRLFVDSWLRWSCFSPITCNGVDWRIDDWHNCIRCCAVDSWCWFCSSSFS